MAKGIPTHKKSLSAIALSYTVLMTSLLALVIIKSLKLTGAEDNHLLLGLNSTLLGIAGTGAFLMVFHYGITQTSQLNLPDARHLLPVTFIALSLAYVFFHHKLMDLNVFFLTTLLLMTVSTWLSFRMAFRKFDIPSTAEKNIPRLAALALAIFGFVVWQLQNFWSLDQLLVAAGLYHSFLVGTGVALTALFFSIHPKYAISGAGIKENYEMRSRGDKNKISLVILTTLAAYLQLGVSLLLIYNVWPLQSNTPTVAVVALQLLFIPAIIDAWQDVSKLGIDRERFQQLSRLTINSAKRLFTRHAQSRPDWSATIGFKSAILRLEHDVDYSFAASAPNTIQKIRHEQAAHIIEQLIHEQSIDIQSSQERINCIIDPETSLYPCLDALKVSATMYMDAGSILEKRMLGLISLLPIVNQELSTIVDRVMIEDSLKRTRWFFYFDYQWVEQNLTTTPRLTRYGINVDQIDPELRIHLLEKMRNLHAIGNFIWIGKGGQEKLLQEAPSLQNVMTPHQIKLRGGREFFLFSMKFEELIPRLQRYHALDEFRKKIIDFEPNKAAQKLLNIFLLQLNNAKDVQERMRIADIIASYRWRGFREKDLALRLLVSTYEFITTSVNMEEQTSVDMSDVKRRLYDAITRIGYPSQLMNQAHMYKIELRRLKNLQLAALDITHPWHLESWATLASLNYKNMDVEEIKVLQSIFARAAKHQQMFVSSVIQARILDSLVALIKSQMQTTQTPDVKIFLEVINAIVASKQITYESACVLLDNLNYVEKLTGAPVIIPKAVSNYFDALEDSDENASSYQRQSFLNNWKEFKGRNAQKLPSKSKAS